MIDRALQFATRVHASQFDKAGQPYIQHCIRVADQCWSTEAQVIALLHDTVEDCPACATELKHEFGVEIYSWVNWLTRPRGCTYVNYIKSIALYSISREVKIADLRDNMDLRRLPHITCADLKRQSKYLDALTVLENRS